MDTDDEATTDAEGRARFGLDDMTTDVTESELDVEGQVARTRAVPPLVSPTVKQGVKSIGKPAKPVLDLSSDSESDKGTPPISAANPGSVRKPAQPVLDLSSDSESDNGASQKPKPMVAHDISDDSESD